MKIRTNAQEMKRLAHVRSSIYIRHVSQFSWHLLILCHVQGPVLSVGQPLSWQASGVMFYWVQPASSSLLPSSLHLTEHVGGCWPQDSSDESWVRSGQSDFFFPHVFAMGLVSKVNIWTHSIKWSPGKKTKQNKTNTCSFALGFSLKQMNPWCMKRLSGWLKEAECWDKAGRLLLHAPMWGLFSWVKQGLARQAVPL